MSSNAFFSIVCVDEGSIHLSNARPQRDWDNACELALALNRSLKFSTDDELLAWKKERNHISSAREMYSWRSAIEAIKDRDLRNVANSNELSERTTDRPIMLKISGEVASALMHSYNLRHRISFSQITSNLPSGSTL